MMKSMLSFHRGNKIAHAIDKKGNKVLTIFITPDEENSDIEVDNINELIDEDDFENIKNMMRLTTTEIKMIKKAIKDDRFEILNDRLKLSLSKLKELASKKLKTHLLFDKSKEIERVVPLIGGAEFDRSIFLTGPSGSGKSFLAKEIMKHDEKNRPIIIFSKIDNDISLNDLKKLKITNNSFQDNNPDEKDSFTESEIKKEIGNPRMIKIDLKTEDDLLNLPSNEELKNCVCLFDDIDSFPSEISDFLNNYRDIILESGRHNNITVLSTSHQLYNWSKTRVILNEAEMVGLFPHSNKRSAMIFLKDRMGLNKNQIDNIINECMNCSRFLICKTSFPQMCIHEKGVILI